MKNLDGKSLRGDFRPGYIYFIRVLPDGPIKIGRTNKLALRLSDLQVANHAELKLMLVVRDDGNYERMLHRKFNYCRIRGEWFRSSDSVIDLITTLTGESEDFLAIGSQQVPLFIGQLATWLEPLWSSSSATVDPNGPSVRDNRPIDLTGLADDLISPCFSGNIVRALRGKPPILASEKINRKRRQENLLDADFS